MRRVEGGAVDHPELPRHASPLHFQHERAVEQPQTRVRRARSAHQAAPCMLPGLGDPRLDHRHVGSEQFGPPRMPRVLPGQQLPPRSIQVPLALPAKGMRRRPAHRRPGTLAPVRDISKYLKDNYDNAPVDRLPPIALFTQFYVFIEIFKKSSPIGKPHSRQ